MTFGRLQLRRDTAANWTSANPTLASGEVGYETNTGKRKIGDGATAWTSLAYAGTTWGLIGGTLTDQADLVAALAAKADAVGLAAYVDERARDAVGTALVQGNRVVITPNDGADTITIAVAAYQGALVRKASNQTTANYTTATAVAWDQEAYDTSTIHDNSSNNTRLTVPSGATRVRLSACISLASVTADMYVIATIRKGGSASYDGVTSITVESGTTTPTINLTSPVLTVTAGDYFEVYLAIETDNSVTVTAASSWFAMEVIE